MAPFRTPVRGAALALALLGCAGAPRPGAPSAGEGPCVLPAAAVAPRAAGPLVVGLPGPVDPSHAPVPRSDAERLAFAQLYETLVRVTCEGRVEPLLASSWTSEQDGRAWTFTLRPDLRAWDGTAVGAAEVARGWLATGRPTGIASLSVLDARTLRVELPHPEDVGFFARPELAVALPAAPGEWRAGTGPYRPVDPAGGPLRRLELAPLRGQPPLELRAMGADPRNALDAGADILVTAEPEALAYAASTGGFETVPLPWDRAWLLLLATPAGPPPPEAALEALARDAVRVEARAAEASGTLAACGHAAEGAPRGGERIVYGAGDPVAHGIAERLVALALAGERSGGWLADAAPGLVRGEARPTTRSLGADAFAAALREGSGAAFVIAVPTGGACDLLRAAAARAPWVGATAIVPLVETRRTAIVRRGIGGVVVDGAGTLLLGGARVGEGGGP